MQFHNPTHDNRPEPETRPMERMTDQELDFAAARLGFYEREAADLRSQLRQQITYWGDQRRRKLRGRLFEFFAKAKTVEVRRAV